ncbi:Modifier of mdg4 [Operophtera brumata]|uniref:Modifier of mdg4 n=1 Tax=Operophtera brumata TaxID=104452 RepID=A0A0L7LNV5_OPEBR|nr:Modifier of mdg4 [Operophtera brumata]
MYNGFTYSQNSKTENNFYCTRRRLGKCRAKVKVTTEGRLESVNQFHNHDPPNYVTIGGKLVKITNITSFLLTEASTC